MRLLNRSSMPLVLGAGRLVIRGSLYAQRLAKQVKSMAAAGFSLQRGKQSVGELLVVVAQELGAADWAGPNQSMEKFARNGSALVLF